MLTIEDLTVKYNWWSGKELKKLPALFDLDEQDDFDGIFSLRLYVILMMEGLQLKVFKSMKKNENRTLLIYITVLTSALDAEETLNTDNSNDASSPMRQVSLVLYVMYLLIYRVQQHVNMKCMHLIHQMNILSCILSFKTNIDV